MKNIWKNVLGVALIAAISSGAAIGTSTYLMNKNQRPVELASGVENTFKQPYRLTRSSISSASVAVEGSNVRNSNLVWAPARVSLSLRMVISSRTTT